MKTQKISTPKKSDKFIFSAGNALINGWGVDVHSVVGDEKKEFFILKLFRYSGHLCGKGNILISREQFREQIQEDDPYNQSAELVRALELWGVKLDKGESR